MDCLGLHTSFCEPHGCRQTEALFVQQEAQGIGQGMVLVLQGKGAACISARWDIHRYRPRPSVSAATLTDMQQNQSHRRV